MTDEAIANPDRDLVGLRAAVVDVPPALRGLLAHHLNNALAVILGAGEWLLPQLSGEQHDVVVDAMAAARRIVGVVEVVCPKVVRR